MIGGAAASSGYSVRDVSGLLGLSVGQVRSYVREGFLSPDRERRGRLRFSFQDVVLLRVAHGLAEGTMGPRIPHARVRRALRRLRAHLPAERPLTGVVLGADGGRIVVRDGGAPWNAESGQVLFDFHVEELVAKVEIARLRAPPDARGWFARGRALEDGDPLAAVEAYRRAIELDVELAAAHLNLGRLLHEAGQRAEALAHYELARAAAPDDAIAAYNLGVALEDLRREVEAIDAYRAALALDPDHADARHNLARLTEAP